MFMFSYLGEDDPPAGGVWRHPEDRERIQRVLDRPGRFRAWNVSFDRGFLEAAGYNVPGDGRWDDGMVMAHIMDERRSVALKFRGAAMFGEDERDLEYELKAFLADEDKRRRAASKESGEEFVPANYQDVPGEIIVPYAAQDVVLTRKVVDQLERRIPPKMRDLYDLEMGVLDAKYHAERRGLPVDAAGAKRLQLSLIGSLDEKDAAVTELAGRKININSGAQILAALERRGFDTSKLPKTAKGNTRCDAGVLESISDPLAAAVLAFRSENKLLGTYVSPMLTRSWDSRMRCWKAPFIQDGRIHGNFRQVGARTGRMSSSDPNLQNWPRDDLRLRYLCRADEGYKLVTCDLDAIEVRVFAYFLGKGAMYEMVMSGEDVHAHTAKMVGLVDRRRPGGAVESARQQGKVMNFTVLYGGGANSVSAYFGVSRTQAKQMIDRFHRAYPEVGRLQRRINQRLYERGYIETPWGRRQRCDGRDVSRESYKFVNYLVQGSAADALKQGIVACHADGVPLVAFVHDELLAHVPEADAEAVAATMQRHMTNIPQLSWRVPITAEAAIVDRWSQAKDPDYVPLHERP